MSMESGKKKKMIVTGICAVALLAAAGGFFLMRGKEQGAGGTGGAGRPGGMGGMTQEMPVTVVKASVPSVGDLELSTSLTGTVEAADVVYVYAKASGDVTSVRVQAGDTVKAGQVICEIDTEQVESALNSLQSAELRLSEARSNLSRMQVLYQGGDLSEQEYEQYTNAVETARLSYEAAKLAYDRQVEYSTVTAPISGRIESCDVEVYDRVSQSTQLCVISGEGQSRILFYVTQRMMNNIRVGDAMEVVKNGTVYPGTISEVSSMVDDSTGLFKVKAEMENTDEIAIGSTVKLNVVTERTEGAMLVPVNAIYYSGGDGYVYLYQDGEAKMTPVEVGLYDSESAEILSGLKAGDMVVSTWSSNLYEGAKIRLYGEEDTGEEGAAGGRDNAGNGENAGSRERGGNGQGRENTGDAGNGGDSAGNGERGDNGGAGNGEHTGNGQDRGSTGDAGNGGERSSDGQGRPAAPQA